MKYLGVAYACVTAVVAAAAIYLLEARLRPTVRTRHSRCGRKVAGWPHAFRRRGLILSTRIVAVACGAGGRRGSASEAGKLGERPARNTENRLPSFLAAENEPHLLPQEQATAKAPDAEQPELGENKLTEVQTATDVPTTGAATPDIIVAIATATGSGTEVGADLLTPRAPTADLPAPSRNEALLPHQNSGAEATPKSEQAPVEQNSTESAEPTLEYRTASAADDFDYVSAALPNEIAPIVVPGPGFAARTAHRCSKDGTSQIGGEHFDRR